jgi:DNA primase
MKMIDRKLNYVLAKADVNEIIRIYFPDWDGRANVMCPYHTDTKPSLNITVDGKAHCYGCNWSATNLVALVAAMEGVPYLEARDLLYKQVTNSIPDAKVRTFRKHLLKERRKYVTNIRGLSEEVINDHNLGYDPHTHRITIPILDQFGECVNIRYMGWTKEQRAKSKVYNEKGHGEARLYPEWKMMDEDVIILVEGEWDCLVGRTHGLPTVTWTGGAGAWDSSYNWMFKGKHVLILYDADSAGQEGAKHALEQVSRVAKAEIVTEPQRWKGKDLSEWVSNNAKHTVGYLDVLCGMRKAELNKPRAQLCPCCGQEVKND